MGRPRLKANVIFYERFDRIKGSCWVWNKRINIQTGYGEFIAGGIMYSAHRFSYTYFIGKIPEGFHVHHKCENRRCVNPEHLEALTHKEHLLMGNGLCAINARKTHCIKGHEFTKQNTYITPDNRRQCRKCNYLRLKKCLNIK